MVQVHSCARKKREARQLIHSMDGEVLPQGSPKETIQNIRIGGERGFVEGISLVGATPLHCLLGEPAVKRKALAARHLALAVVKEFQGIRPCGLTEECVDLRQVCRSVSTRVTFVMAPVLAEHFRHHRDRRPQVNHLQPHLQVLHGSVRLIEDTGSVKHTFVDQ
jgi:hypothetical protein